MKIHVLSYDIKALLPETNLMMNKIKELDRIKYKTPEDKASLRELNIGLKNAEKQLISASKLDGKTLQSVSLNLKKACHDALPKTNEQTNKINEIFSKTEEEYQSRITPEIILLHNLENTIKAIQKSLGTFSITRTKNEKRQLQLSLIDINSVKNTLMEDINHTNETTDDAGNHKSREDNLSAAVQKRQVQAVKHCLKLPAKEFKSNILKLALPLPSSNKQGNNAGQLQTTVFQNRNNNSKSAQFLPVANTAKNTGNSSKRKSY